VPKQSGGYSSVPGPDDPADADPKLLLEWLGVRSEN
jgi:hypothetical protein